jgi:hypothetical protein
MGPFQTAILALVAVSLLAAPAQARKRAYAHDDTYTNVDGHTVHRPVGSATPPPGWTAQCRDGSYSFSEHHRGTCSHHGGVARWR